MNEVTTLVKECSACGGDHEMVFYRLATPVSTPEGTYGYSGLCVTVNKPVFMRYNEKKEVDHGCGTSPS